MLKIGISCDSNLLLVSADGLVYADFLGLTERVFDFFPAVANLPVFSTS